MARKNPKQRGKPAPPPPTRTRASAARPKAAAQSNAAAAPMFPFLPDWAPPVVLAVLALALYAGTLGHDFALDDRIVYTENAYVLQGFDGIDSLLTEDTFRGFYKEDKNLLTGGRYRPLSLVTFAVEYELFGGGAPPGESGSLTAVGHAVNVLLFMATVLLLFGIMKRHFFGGKWELAFLIAALFALHPIHTEVVANIKSRDELMGFLFMLLTLDAAFRFFRADLKTNKKALLWLTLVPVFFGLGLLSKENSVTWLAILPLSLWYFAPKINGAVVARAAVATAPLLLVFAVYIGLRIDDFTAETTNQSIMNDPYMPLRLQAEGGDPDAMSALPEKAVAEAKDKSALATKFLVLGKYVGMLFAPTQFSWNYSYAQIPYVDWGVSKAVAGLLAHLALLFYGLYTLLKPDKRNLLGWACWVYLAGISIVSNIAFDIGDFMGERFLYQPSWAFAAAAGAAIYWLTRGKALDGSTGRSLALAVFGLLAAFYIVKVLDRTPDWKNDDFLYVADFPKVPEAANARQAGAGVFYRVATDTAYWNGGKPVPPQLQPSEGVQLGDPSIRRAYVDSARKHYLKALEINPKFKEATDDIQVVYAEYNKYYHLNDTMFQAALNWNPSQGLPPQYNPQKATELFEKARANRANTFYAISLMKKALYYQPDFYDYWFLMAEKLFFPKYNYLMAAKCFQQCLELRPGDAQVMMNMGVCLFNAKQYAQAKSVFDRVKVMAPNTPGLQQAYQRLEENWKP